jgi:hypothetical protein
MFALSTMVLPEKHNYLISQEQSPEKAIKMIFVW